MTRCASRTTHDRAIKAIRNARAKMRGMATPHRLGVILAAALAMTKPALAANITKESLTIERTSRTYFMFVPDSVAVKPAPLVITLHGSGRDGRPLVESFRGRCNRSDL